MDFKNPKILIGAGIAVVAVIAAVIGVVVLTGSKKDSKSEANNTVSSVTTNYKDALLKIDDPEQGKALAKVNAVTTNFDKNKIRNNSKIPSTVKIIKVDITVYNLGKEFSTNETDYYLIKKGTDKKLRTMIYVKDSDLVTPFGQNKINSSLPEVGSLYFDVTEELSANDLSFGYEPVVNLGKVSNMKIDLSTATLLKEESKTNVDVTPPTATLKDGSALYKDSVEFKITKVTRNYVPEKKEVQAYEGNEYLKIELTATNTGTKKTTSYSFPRVIDDTERQILQSSYRILGEFTKEKPLEPGASQTYTLYYDVIKDNAHTKLNTFVNPKEFVELF